MGWRTPPRTGILARTKMVPWEVSSYGHEYATAPWALYLVAVALVVAVVAFAAAILPPARARRERPLAGLGMLAFGAFVFGVAYVAGPVAAWWFSDDPLFGGGEARSYVVFRRLLQLEVGWAVVSAIVVFVTLLLLQRRRVEARFARVAVLIAMASLAMSALVAGHATLLVQLDCLPRFDRKGHGFLHVGRARTVELGVACGAQYEPPPPMEVTATAPGDLTLHVEKSYPLVHVERTLTLRAGEETGPGRLQVRAGNEWVYARTEVSRLTENFVEHSRHEQREEVRVSIGEPHLVGGMRFFPLDVRFPEAENVVHLEVVGYDGELRMLEDGQLRTIVAAGTLGEPTDTFLLPGVCQGEPPAGAPKAPAECRVPVNTMAGLGASLMRIITLGVATYVPGREVYFLERATWGPEGGEEIPVAPPRPES